MSNKIEDKSFLRIIKLIGSHNIKLGKINSISNKKHKPSNSRKNNKEMSSVNQIYLQKYGGEISSQRFIREGLRNIFNSQLKKKDQEILHKI